MHPFLEIEREIRYSYRSLQDCSGIKVLATKPHAMSPVPLDPHAGGENRLFHNLSFDMDTPAVVPVQEHMQTHTCTQPYM